MKLVIATGEDRVCGGVISALSGVTDLSVRGRVLADGIKIDSVKADGARAGV